MKQPTNQPIDLQLVDVLLLVVLAVVAVVATFPRSVPCCLCFVVRLLSDAG